MSIPLYQIDAFSPVPFAGNPAAVCLLNAMPSPGWMQDLAAENNLSETAYTLRDASNGVRPLRWFTPTTEVDLCGHATLATARALLAEGLAQPGETLRFSTLSGEVSARFADEGWIELNFPMLPVEPCEAPAGLLEALRVRRPLFIGRNHQDVLIELRSEDMVRAVAPGFAALARVDTGGVIVTARAGERTKADFVSRYFAPREGINEDPVTGSAHCALGPYWGEKLWREQVTGFQASKRGGMVRVTLAGERVFIAGQAAVVFRADLESNE